MARRPTRWVCGIAVWGEDPVELLGSRHNGGMGSNEKSVARLGDDRLSAKLYWPSFLVPL